MDRRHNRNVSSGAADLVELQRLLDTLPPGPVDGRQVDVPLSFCWHLLDGSGQEHMSGEKLLRRIENASWDGRLLSFEIARHGGTVMGSTRAAVHEWRVDLAARTARLTRRTHRQLLPREPALNLKPVAAELVQAILAHKKHRWLSWRAPQTVRIDGSAVIPDGSAFKQTLTGRRKRLRKLIADGLTQAGWQERSPWLFERQNSQ